MESRYEAVETSLRQQPRRWLVTGAGGFIGSSLVETLLGLGQTVVGLDDFSTGHRENLEGLPPGDFRLVEGDIRDPEACREACRGIDIVLHQAALSSVPRSVQGPLATHSVNVDGFVNVLLAARDARVQAFVYASSSSVYGDHPLLPKMESHLGAPLSPYALSKAINEQYAAVFARCYGFPSIGLRYFNVFGPRQDPDGPYAAVVPRWIETILAGVPCEIYGDGKTSRDFCYVKNVVQANLLAALAPAGGGSPVYNVAQGGATTLTELHAMGLEGLAALVPDLERHPYVLRPPRASDIRHSLASLSAISRDLGYRPSHTLGDGFRETLPWYVARSGRGRAMQPR